MKGADRARQGFALVDDWLRRLVAWIGAQHRDQGLDVRFRARTVIGGHLELQTIRPPTRSSILPLFETRETVWHYHKGSEQCERAPRASHATGLLRAAALRRSTVALAERKRAGEAAREERVGESEGQSPSGKTSPRARPRRGRRSSRRGRRARAA